ncbi:MAG: hypothetical protein D4R69_05870 [Actinomycetales bacterium]|nr:MAG: hypothetical protein D4R69_05870 [Actinomycetales bacterium]
MARYSKVNNYTFVIFLITLLGLFHLDPSIASAATPKPKEIKAPCRLEVSIAHLSTDLFEKSRIRAVKVDSSSICNVQQRNVTITVEIWKTGLLGNHLVLRKSITSSGATFPGARVNNFVTYVICKNRTNTSYYGVSYSKAFIEGKWQYARHVLSREILPLRCGT